MIAKVQIRVDEGLLSLLGALQDFLRPNILSDTNVIEALLERDYLFPTLNGCDGGVHLVVSFRQSARVQDKGASKHNVVGGGDQD